MSLAEAGRKRSFRFGAGQAAVVRASDIAAEVVVWRRTWLPVSRTVAENVALEEPLKRLKGFRGGGGERRRQLEEILPVLPVVAWRGPRRGEPVSQLVDAALSDGSRRAGVPCARADGVRTL